MIRKIFSISFNSLKIAFKDKGSIFWLIIMPIIWIVLVGSMGSNGKAIEKIQIGIVNEDKGLYGEFFENLLDKKEVIVLREEDEDMIKKDIEDGKLSLGVLIPKDFSKSLIQGKITEIKIIRSNDPSSYLLYENVKKIIDRISIDALCANFTLEKTTLNENEREKLWGELFKLGDNTFKNSPIHVEYKVLSVQEKKSDIPTGMDASSPGFSVMFVMMGVLFAAASLVRERENRTLARLLTTPTNRFTIISGKMFGFFLIGFVQFLILILFSQFVLGVNWGNSPIGVLLLVIAYVLSVNGIGMLISVFVRTSSQANALAVLLSIVTSMLGGAWWPIEIAPRFMQIVAKFTPQYWAINGFNKIITRGFGFVSILPNFYILISIAGIMLFMAVFLFKFE